MKKYDIPLFNTKEGKRVLIVIIFVLLVTGMVVVLFSVFNNEAEITEEYQPRIDPISGETIWNIDEEPEIGSELVLIGFNKIASLGFMSSQYKKIIEEIELYIENNYPSCLEASYWEGTFKYLNEERTVSSFRFVIDDDRIFDVMLDTKDSLTDIDVKILKAEG